LVLIANKKYTKKRKRKIIGFRTEEELADVVNEIVNYSDSDTDTYSRIFK